MMTREAVTATLKPLIIRALRIEDMTADDLRDDQALLDGEGGIDIDSIDVLQLILEIERTFNVKLVSGEFARGEWQTIQTLAAAIEEKLRAQTDEPPSEF